MTNINSIEKYLEEAVVQGRIECPQCNNYLEPDCPICGECGWENPLIKQGLI